ncbi:hypothetical protein SAMN05661012_02104 [Chitinophaga sancti]|uniref:Uncharacterized protein n=1 Tax=Chitinophaga sancti TaxID=1004 RepID=A0A1K1PM33_9BACT|nr:hypothetical protein SAMN05661012_02104 [Chitinophaga sancti]
MANVSLAIHADKVIKNGAAIIEKHLICGSNISLVFSDCYTYTYT